MGTIIDGAVSRGMLRRMPVSRYHYNNSYGVLVARTFDILLCSWVWRDYDLTISSMCGLELRKVAPAWWAVVLGRWILNHIETNHCELALKADEARALQALDIIRQVARP